MKDLVSLVRATHHPLVWVGLGTPILGEGLMVKHPKAQGEEVLGERANPS